MATSASPELGQPDAAGQGNSDVASANTSASLETALQKSVARPSRPAGTHDNRILWPFAVGIVLFHLIGLLAFVPWLFSWTGVAMVFIGNYIFCSLGIGACYHRLLTHRAFRCKPWLEHTLAVCGVCTLQGSPARWVTVHRLHHNHSDEDQDPHSPLVAWFWGHMGWAMIENPQLRGMATYDKYARDILQDPFYLRLERGAFWVWVYAIHAVVIYALGVGVGYLWGGTLAAGFQFGLSMLLWGVVIRTLYTWHVTWGVNSFAHMWGYRNYETTENSRNNWVIALATNGEGWHNNHHADPRSAAHGHRWWELDVTYATILLFRRLGWVWDVTTPHRNRNRRTSQKRELVTSEPVEREAAVTA